MSAAPGEMSKKSLESLAIRLLSESAGIAMGLMIARALGPAGKGVFTYAVTVLAILLPISGGSSAAVSRQYGKLRRSGRTVGAALLRFSLFVVLPISAALILYGIAARDLAAGAAGAAFPFAAIGQVVRAFALTDGDVRWANFQALSIAAALAAGVGAAILLSRDNVDAALAAWVAVYAGVAAWSLLYVRPYVRRGEVTDAARAFAEHARFAGRVALNQGLAIVNYRIDVFIVMALLGPAELGIYSIAIGLGQMMWHLSRPLALTSYSAVTRGSRAEATRVTLICVRHALLNVTAGCAVLAIVGPRLIEVVYGERFAASGPVLLWLLPGIVAYCTMPFFSQYFTLQLGKPGVSTAITAGSIVVCGAFTAVEIPHLGIVAGAIGTSLSYVAALCGAVWWFCRSTSTPPWRLLAFQRADLREYVVLARWLAARGGT